MNAAPRDQGAAGLVTLFATVLVLVVAAAGIAASGDLSATAARSRSAADAAALAGMGTSPLVSPAGAQPADAAARDVARANRARFVSGDQAGWPLRYAVTVEMYPATPWVRRIVGPIRAKATAAVRPLQHQE